MLMNMVDLLKVANENHFAVPAFNIGSSEILKGVIEACEEKNSPVIVQIHPAELEFAGDSFVEMVKAEAIRTKIPVVIHLDHGGSIEELLRAIRDGFTSVMIDASHYPYEENVRLVKEAVAIAHPLNVSVEAELGTIGTTGNSAEGGTDKIIYTDPDLAVKFVKETGTDTLAVAIGTAHGIYPKDMKPELKLDLLQELKDVLDIPLVLHGGSNNPDDEIERSVEIGISKVNIASDIKEAFFQGCRKVLENPNVREPHDVYGGAFPYMKKVIFEKIALFHSGGKAELY